MPRRITDYFLYQWRYQIGYTIISIAIAALLVMAVFFVPGELRRAEINSAVASFNLPLTSFDPNSVINLPYRLLQKLSFEILGISTFSVKLPSLLLGLASIAGMIILVRQWLHDNVAAIVVLIVATASQFIFASQDGTPNILYVLFPIYILIFALKTSRQIKQRSIWEVALFVTVALSIYTPLSIYIILALGSATILHPHLRYIASNIPKLKVIAAALIGLVVLSPLILAVILDPKIGLSLLGIPSTMPDLVSNIKILGQAYFDFTSSGPGQFLPMYNLSSLLLAILGLTRIFTTRYTARSYIITSWLILLIPISLINPTKTIVAFVPFMLLTAAGIDVLLHRWYRLFPRNPYARVAGLIPIVLLVVGISLTGIERYFYGYRYTPVATREYSNDLKLIGDIVSSLESKPVELIVTKDEQEFYKAVYSNSKNVKVGLIDKPLPENKRLIVTRGAFYERRLGEPDEIVTSDRKENSDRLYLYKINSH